MGPNLTHPEHILLICSKYEAHLSLTWVLLTQPNETFWPDSKKIEKFGIFKENFPNLEVADLTRPNPSNKKMTRTHHYYLVTTFIVFTDYKLKRKLDNFDI